MKERDQLLVESVFKELEGEDRSHPDFVGKVLWTAYRTHGDFQFPGASLNLIAKELGLSSGKMWKVYGDWVYGDSTYPHQCPSDQLFYSLYGVFRDSRMAREHFIPEDYSA